MRAFLAKSVGPRSITQSPLLPKKYSRGMLWKRVIRRLQEILQQTLQRLTPWQGGALF